MLGTWDLKSVVVLSNAQPFDRILLIYYRVREVPFDIPIGYMKGCSIYRLVRGRNTSPQDAVQEINDNSYI